MPRSDEYALKAAFRLPAKGDTLGMPLFASTSTSNNALWCVETDDFLRIRRFYPFTRETDGIEWIDDLASVAAYRKGDYAPIPVWIRSEKRIFAGGVAAEDLELEVQEEDQKRSVLRRLHDILARARRKEWVSRNEPDDFWRSYRFLSQNFSGGLAWLRHLGSVIRQSDAYLRFGALEKDIVVELIWRWVDTYVGRIRRESFEEFARIISEAPPGFFSGQRKLILSIALLDQFLSGPGKARVLKTISDIGLPDPADARDFVMNRAADNPRARRFALRFQARYTAEVEKLFYAADREILTFYEITDDLASLVFSLGATPLPNDILFRIPIIIKTYFDRMREVDKILDALNDAAKTRLLSQDGAEGDPGSDDAELLRMRLELLRFSAEIFARLAGGERGVRVMHKAYERRCEREGGRST